MLTEHQSEQRDKDFQAYCQVQKGTRPASVSFYPVEKVKRQSAEDHLWKVIQAVCNQVACYSNYDRRQDLITEVSIAVVQSKSWYDRIYEKDCIWPKVIKMVKDCAYHLVGEVYSTRQKGEYIRWDALEVPESMLIAEDSDGTDNVSILENLLADEEDTATVVVWTLAKQELLALLNDAQVTLLTLIYNGVSASDIVKNHLHMNKANGLQYIRATMHDIQGIARPILDYADVIVTSSSAIGVS